MRRGSQAFAEENGKQKTAIRNSLLPIHWNILPASALYFIHQPNQIESMIRDYKLVWWFVGTILMSVGHFETPAFALPLPSTTHTSTTSLQKDEKTFKIIRDKVVYSRWRSIISRVVQMPNGNEVDFDVSYKKIAIGAKKATFSFNTNDCTYETRIFHNVIHFF